MSQKVQHAPKHRAPAVRRTPGSPRRALRTSLLVTSLAVTATGVAVAGGVASGPVGDPVQAATSLSAAAFVPGGETDPATAAATDDEVTAAELGDRSPTVSRSDRRDATDPEKEEALAADDAPAMTETETLSDDAPRDIAAAMLPEFGFSSDQMGCLDSLWTKESGWDVYADNPTSSAYGIPQALPGSKMSTAGADWATNPVTQIRWGLGYIQDSYGSPCAAWDHSQGYNWY